MKKHISYEAAAKILLSQPATPRETEVDIEEALWRILARDIRAGFPMPPFDKSPFDGFALNAEETPGTLTIRGETPAGCADPEALLPGTAMRIFTGAPIPEGANTIVKFEDVLSDGRTVTVQEALTPGTNIVRAGEDYPEGELLVSAGSRLSAAQLGLMASQGIRRVPIFEKPKVLILSTGTELSEPGEARLPYGIYNSSYYSLSGYLRCMGFEVRYGGTVPDDRELIEGRIASAMESDADLVITTGGASVGDYDFAVRSAEELGMDILFWKVNMKPGGALMAARSGEKLYIALSGNPAAATMSLLTVVQPFLRRLSGAEIGNTAMELPLLHEMPKSSTAVRMLRGQTTIRDGVTFFDEHPGRGNGHMMSFTHCNLIGIIPANSGSLTAGTVIPALELPEDLCF